VCFVSAGRSTSYQDAKVLRTDYGVELELSELGVRVDLVEHLLGAFAGLGIKEGVSVAVSGPEVPLLGGGAAELARALKDLGIKPGVAALRVLRSSRVEVGPSIYEFEPEDRTEIEVQVEFPGVGVQRAGWNGGAEAFVSEIAPARTFGFARDGERLKQLGRARHVDTTSVLVFDESGKEIVSCRPMSENELARHKLLDLLGDLYLYGGPPIGRLSALRPGHTCNHAAVRLALERGVLCQQ
jgi:UDP-3-O-[3-hydroxymyristoyl] N-acetylglucosamine deacetylase